MPVLARRAIAAARGNPGWVLAILGLAAHLWASRGYDYFRDEMYFIVCGERLDWGFVDQPPLIPAFAATMHHLFPGSLVMLRLLPALAHAATIVLVAATARQLGGGVWAQAVAALCVLTGGVFLGIGTTLSTGAMEALAGLFCAYALIRIIRGKDERWWLAMGIAAGIALQEKYLIAFWLAALGLGLIATPARRVFLSPYLHAGAVIAAIIALPNLLWQAANGWPFLEMGRVAVERKNVVVPPLEFLWQTIQQFNEAGGVVWLSGLVGFAVWRRFADLRLFAIAFVALVAALIVLQGKTRLVVRRGEGWQCRRTDLLAEDTGAMAGTPSTRRPGCGRRRRREFTGDPGAARQRPRPGAGAGTSGPRAATPRLRTCTPQSGLRADRKTSGCSPGARWHRLRWRRTTDNLAI